MFKFVSLVITALLLGAPVQAQDHTPEIDRIFSGTTPASCGCVVAVSKGGKMVVNRAYGSADLERDVPLSASSVFDAGSLTKQFVAAAVLLLVEEGRVSLTDDIRKSIPELPDTGHRITVDQLLTHTSGIRDWTGIAMLADGDDDALQLILRQRGLNFTPGDEWSYSNSGYVLLKEMVTRTSGMSFADFTRKRLFEPLGMKSTLYLMNMRDIVKNRALAYEKRDGRWQMAMLLDNDRGGGGALLSTAGDLVLWNDALTSARLGGFVSEKLHEPARLNNGRKIGYGRGLFLGTYRGTREVWHTGSAAGYKGWLGRFPEHGLSIAILCNSGDGTDQTGIAHRIADLFVPATGSAPDENGPPPEVTGDALLELNGRVGLFVNEKTGEPMRLMIDRGRFRVAGGPGLVPVAKDRYRRFGNSLQFMSEDAFELTFLSTDQFELKSMEGRTSRFRRAQRVAPTAAELAAFAGRFESDDLRSVFHVEPGKDGLTFRLNGSPGPGLEFKPVDQDTFQFSRMTVRFRRDEAGKVIGMDYSNPLIRGIRFVRLSDIASRP